MPMYKIKYRWGNSVRSTRLLLQGGTESETVMKLKQQNSVPKDADIVILSIEKA